MRITKLLAAQAVVITESINDFLPILSVKFLFLLPFLK